MNYTNMFGLGCLLLVALTITVRAETPETCCLPVKFEGKLHTIQAQFISVFHGKVKHFFMNGTMSMDFSPSVNRLGFRADITSDKTMHVKIVEDLEFSTMHIILDDQCATMPMPIPVKDNCILEHATYNGREKLGGVGDDGLEVDIWNINKGLTSVEMHFVKDTCVPVFQALKHSSFGFNLAQGSLFTEPKFEVSDPSVFDIPDSCHVKDPEKERALMAKFGFSSGCLPVTMTVWLVLGNLFLSFFTG